MAEEEGQAQRDARALEAIRNCRRAMRLCFGSPAGQDVLVALSQFCCAVDSCVAAAKGGQVDIQRTLVLEGRREVWLTIQNNLNLTEEHLFYLATGRHVQIEQEDDDVDHAA